MPPFPPGQPPHGFQHGRPPFTPGQPPHGAQHGQPPFTSDQPPSPPSGGRGRKVLIGGAIALAVLAGAAGAGLVALSAAAPGREPKAGPSGSATPSAPDTAGRLTQAVAALERLPGIRYKGTLAGASATVGLNVMVLRHGTAYGTLDLEDAKVSVLSVAGSSSGDTFVKGGRDYWSAARGVAASVAGSYVGKWVKVAPGKGPVTVFDGLTPARLARMIVPPGSRPEPEPGAEDRVNGVAVEKLRLPFGHVYLTTAPPYRVVRIEMPGTPEREPDTDGGTGTDGGADGDGDSGTDGGVDGDQGTGAETAGPDLTHAVFSRPSARVTAAPARARRAQGHLDLTEMTAEDVGTSLAALKTRVRGLRSSIDSRVSVAVKGTGGLSPCDSSACTAHARLTNRLAGQDPGHGEDAKVAVDVTIGFRLDGSPVGSCTRRLVMRPNSTGQVSCRITYHARSDRSHYMDARITALPRTVTAGGVRDMLDALGKEG
ncbi:hypothetical protein [Sphaerisporangium rhizosphaerae]|uniref:Uncharacterized protein n=1 Tax=Sphaerisporangium rhizosphaerae TaxID=2269375 RepID=A0ABW2P136_9ACTN